MQWEKLGQIFEFEKSPFRDRYASHAQSPQATAIEGGVRIFFSTRTIGGPGLFTSHVQYVDYSSDFKELLGYSQHEVIPLGHLGCFDEHGIFPLSPTRAGDQLLAYTNGISRRVSVAVETGIGMATSSDNGRTFQKLGEGPVLSASTDEPFMVGDPFVRAFGGTFHMFYIYGTRWSEESQSHAPERVYKVGHAISQNGVDWKKTHRQIIENKIDEDECQALPTVIRIGRRYHMYFCYRHMAGFRDQKDKGYRLGYAYSNDLVDWTRDDGKSGIDLSDEGWDSTMMCYPNIFEYENEIYLLYNGNSFGRGGFGMAKLVSE